MEIIEIMDIIGNIIGIIVNIIRIIIGLILVLFLPGFALTFALFPKDRIDREIDMLERIALSIGLSISVVVLSILILNSLFGISINLITSLLTILLLTSALFIVGYLRRSKSKITHNMLKVNPK
ncbi:MAG: hypothetical protein DRO92_02760 [Candidatus Altiarchaeales archaeon]|nr:MAG: hypothetical protein DRO92_02760 [Candidatus Altiarchaeales archaeon]